MRIVYGRLGEVRFPNPVQGTWLHQEVRRGTCLRLGLVVMFIQFSSFRISLESVGIYFQSLSLPTAALYALRPIVLQQNSGSPQQYHSALCTLNNIFEHKCHDDFGDYDYHDDWDHMKCEMTWNVKRHEMSNDMKYQMTWNVEWHEMSNDTWYVIHDDAHFGAYQCPPDGHCFQEQVV